MVQLLKKVSCVSGHHPKYLDTKGLVALRRGILLAKHNLKDQSKGYKNHPQLDRFKSVENNVNCIDQYLAEVYNEAKTIDHNFNSKKIDWKYLKFTIPVTEGQLEYEKQHLFNKLVVRNPEQ